MKAELFYTDLRELSKIARANTDIEVLSFDFQQNMPLPHIPCGDVFYKRQLWCYNFCVYSAKTRFAHFFMYDECSAKKGQNEVISFLHYYFRNILDKHIKTLYLFADNCSSQNKNNALVQYIYSIVQTNTFGFKTVVQRYPELGHSFLPCDRCFGLIEQKKRKIERVFIPETYKNMVKETCADKFHVIDVVPDNMLYNFSEYLKPFFKKNFISSTKTKFTLMLYRTMEYNENGLFCSVIANTNTREKFIIHKSNLQNIFTVEHQQLPSLYQSSIKIKAAKLQDVRALAAKYVPPEYLWFYEQLESLSTNNNESDEEI